MKDIRIAVRLVRRCYALMLRERIVIEPQQLNPHGVLERVIGEPYEEAREEAKAEEWLRSRASR